MHGPRRGAGAGRASLPFKSSSTGAAETPVYLGETLLEVPHEFRWITIIPALALTLSACGPSPEGRATLTATAWTATPTLTATATATATVTPTFTATLTPTFTLTPTITLTPSITPTATYTFPAVVVNQQAHCRYGPSKAYLHAADLYPGDAGTVRGRFAYSSWLYIKFDKLDYFCWAAPSVVDVTGDISLIRDTEPKLPGPSVLYEPPDSVSATRDGNQVTIEWSRVHMTVDDDNGYFIEGWLCQSGAYFWWTQSFPDQYTTDVTVRDDRSGCNGPSGGKLYAVEKHGYTTPVEIPWP